MLADCMAMKGLPTFSEPTSAPVIVAKLRVVLPASVDNYETGEPLEDIALLRKFEGGHPENEELCEVYCIEQATLDPGREGPLGQPARWAHASSVRLKYDAEARALRCIIELDLSRNPTDEELEKLLTVIEKELFYTGWGLNLDWVRIPDGDWSVHVGDAPISHSITPRRKNGSRPT